MTVMSHTSELPGTRVGLRNVEKARHSCCTIVVAYHAQDWINPCFESLASAVDQNHFLCLVDNSGNGNCLPSEFAPGRFAIIGTTTPLGFAEANNYALQQLKISEEAVCFLNQDTKSAPGWLSACIECLRNNPDVGAVAPLLRNYDDTDWDPNFRDCARLSENLTKALDSNTGFQAFYDVPRITAAAIVVRSDVLRKVGPFDPIYGSYYEDYDLCWRIRQAGYRVGVCGHGTVFHYSGSSTTTLAAERKRMRQVIRNRAILRFREAGPKRLRSMLHYFATTFPRNLGRSLLRTPSSQPLGVQLAAHLGLLRELPRLASAKADRRAWQDYLDGLKWPLADCESGRTSVSDNRVASEQ